MTEFLLMLLAMFPFIVFLVIGAMYFLYKAKLLKRYGIIPRETETEPDYFRASGEPSIRATERSSKT